jgi:hypothetical protein
LAGLIVRDSAGTARGGIFPRHAFSLLLARSDMKLDVGAFEGATVRGGPLFMSNDGTIATPTLALAPTANSRLDVVYFKQNEAASPYSDGDNTPTIGIATGTPSAASPLPKPAIPAGAEELGTVTVPSTATATNSPGVIITPTHRFTAMTGGVLLFRTAAERALYLTATPAQRAYAIDNGTEALWTGGRWAVTGEDTGWITLVLGSGSTTADGLTPQIRKKNGIVFTRGRVSQPSAVAFTVPAGFLPSYEMRLGTISGAAGSASLVFVIPMSGAAYTVAGAIANVNFSWIADN